VTQKRGLVEALSQKELHQFADLDFRDPDLRTRLLELRTEMGRSTGQYQGEVSPETWVAHVELARDKFLQCCYTGLRISDADRRGLAACARQYHCARQHGENRRHGLHFLLQRLVQARGPG
jgi:hypothetical protein